MKPVYFTFALIILVATNGFSQDSLQITPHVMAETITNRIDRELVLTATQRQDVYQLLLERSEKYDQAHAKYKSNSLKIKGEKIKINEKSLIKFKKILTREQFQKYENLKAKNKEQVGNLKTNEVSYLSEEDEELDF